MNLFVGETTISKDKREEFPKEFSKSCHPQNSILPPPRPAILRTSSLYSRISKLFSRISLDLKERESNKRDEEGVIRSNRRKRERDGSRAALLIELAQIKQIRWEIEISGGQLKAKRGREETLLTCARRRELLLSLSRGRGSAALGPSPDSFYCVYASCRTRL